MKRERKPVFLLPFPPSDTSEFLSSSQEHSSAPSLGPALTGLGLGDRAHGQKGAAKQTGESGGRHGGRTQASSLK